MSDDESSRSLGELGICKGAALKILLAEDHVLSQAMTVRLLQAEGHEVSVVSTGLQAVDACRDQSFDVVLMDLQLPVLDGLQAIQLIRNGESRSADCHQLIWVLTADSGEGKTTECLKVGADAVLTKPLRPKQLIQQLQNVGLRGTQHPLVETTKGAGISRDVLLESVGQDATLAKKLVDLFLRDYEALVIRFQCAFAQSNFRVLTQEAHSLKSPARVFGASALHSLCDDLERFAVTGEADQLHDLQERFMCELNVVYKGAAEFRF